MSESADVSGRLAAINIRLSSGRPRLLGLEPGCAALELAVRTR